MDKSDILALFDRYKKGKCTQDEIQLLHDWIDSGNFEASPLSQGEILAELQNLETQLPVIRPHKTRSLYSRIRKYAAAAAIIFGVTYIFYHYSNSSNSEKNIQLVRSPLEPGKNVAILHLEDGSPILLDSIEPNTTLELDGALVKRNSEGQLVYIADHSQRPSKTNQLITPNGGQYELVLPDGTRVWLNSESKLTFKNSFEKDTERLVNLEGEAYFEVHPNKDKPFLVSVQDQTIRVLGTSFNVNAYNENKYIKTSLVEGSVLFNQNKLKPGQSALFANNKTKIYTDHIDDIIAWKNGYFVFFEETLADAMKKITRWYDLEVVYSDDRIKDILVGGSISKYENASKVFEMFEKAGDINISISGRKVTINYNQSLKN